MYFSRLVFSDIVQEKFCFWLVFLKYFKYGYNYFDKKKFSTIRLTKNDCLDYYFNRRFIFVYNSFDSLTDRRSVSALSHFCRLYYNVCSEEVYTKHGIFSYIHHLIKFKLDNFKIVKEIGTSYPSIIKYRP